MTVGAPSVRAGQPIASAAPYTVHVDNCHGLLRGLSGARLSMNSSPWWTAGLAADGAAWADICGVAAVVGTPTSAAASTTRL
jgi:hypothetical protein